MRLARLLFCPAVVLAACSPAPPVAPGAPPPVPRSPALPLSPPAAPETGPRIAAAGEAAAAYAAHASMVGSGMSGPNGLALDGGGTLYESDYYRGTVTRVAPDGAVGTYAAGFAGPAGLAFDAAGNLLVACYESHRLERIPPGGGRTEPFVTSGLRQPVWPAVDSRGQIYLADYGAGRLARVQADGTVTTFVNLPGVNAIALDARDHLWVTTWGGQVAEVTPAGAVRQLTDGLGTACAIAWHPDYLAVGTYGEEHQANGRLVLVDHEGRVHPVAANLSRTSSVIFDRAGNLYAANIGDTALRKYTLR